MPSSRNSSPSAINQLEGRWSGSILDDISVFSDETGVRRRRRRTGRKRRRSTRNRTRGERSYSPIPRERERSKRENSLPRSLLSSSRPFLLPQPSIEKALLPLPTKPLDTPSVAAVTSAGETITSTVFTPQPSPMMANSSPAAATFTPHILLFTPPHKKVLLPTTPDMVPIPFMSSFHHNHSGFPKSSPITPLPQVVDYTRNAISSALHPLTIFSASYPGNTVFGAIGSDGSSRVATAQKTKCRDFYQKGFCMRGDQCFFDHGVDPIVIDNSTLSEEYVPTASAVVVTNSQLPPFLSSFDENTTYNVSQSSSQFSKSTGFVPSSRAVEITRPAVTSYQKTYRNSASSGGAQSILSSAADPVVKEEEPASDDEQYNNNNVDSAGDMNAKGSGGQSILSPATGPVVKKEDPASDDDQFTNINSVEDINAKASDKLFQLFEKRSKLYEHQVEQQRVLLLKAQSMKDKPIKAKYLELVKRSDKMLKASKKELESLSQQIIALRKQIP